MPPSDDTHKCRARLFTNGRSQAVRLPKPLRFDADEVYMWRDGDRVILEPVPKTTWPPGYWEMFDATPEFDGEIEPLTPAFLDLSLE
jgi:antitoxin VapB